MFFPFFDSQQFIGRKFCISGINYFLSQRILFSYKQCTEEGNSWFPKYGVWGTENSFSQELNVSSNEDITS